MAQRTVFWGSPFFLYKSPGPELKIMYTKNNPRTKRSFPEENLNYEFRHCSFFDNKTFAEKKNGRLPVMGWNSWNAFGTGNNERLQK